MLRNLLSASTVLAIIFLSACAVPVKDESDTVWIDVRSEAEFQQSSIDGHYTVPHTEITSRITEIAPDKNTPVVLYCGSGRRAGIAKLELEEMGYTHVSNGGGIEDVRKDLKSE